MPSPPPLTYPHPFPPICLPLSSSYSSFTLFSNFGNYYRASMSSPHHQCSSASLIILYVTGKPLRQHLPTERSPPSHHNTTIKPLPSHCRITFFSSTSSSSSTFFLLTHIPLIYKNFIAQISNKFTNKIKPSVIVMISYKQKYSSIMKTLSYQLITLMAFVVDNYNVKLLTKISFNNTNCNLLIDLFNGCYIHILYRQKYFLVN